MVGIPSLLTAFNLTATMERAGRRKGGKGLFLGWIRKLPWGDPAFAGITLALLLFAMGGITGFINAGYHINAVVHNTIWVVGHFHTSAAGGATLTFIGISYYLVPRLVGKELWNKRLALLQSWTWFIGLSIFALSTAIAGLLGSPRRTFNVTYFGAPQAQSWAPYIQISAIGGTLMFIGLLLFLTVMVLTVLKRVPAKDTGVEAKETAHRSTIWDNFKLFALVASVLALAVYVPTLMSLLSVEAPRVVGATPKGPFPDTAPVPEVPPSPSPDAPEVDPELLQKGEQLFASLGCSACHSTDGSPRTGPTMKFVFGREVLLSTGETVISDEDYLKESLIDPDAQIVAGFIPQMMSSVIPSGSLSETEAEALVLYLKTL
jgi:cytochrome c2